MHRGAALLVLAACSGASGSSSSSAVADHRGEKPAARPHQRHTHGGALPVGGIDERIPVPACPRESDLVPRLRELWQVPADATIDVVSCTNGRFRGPGWLIHAFIESGDQDSEERVEILTTDGGGVIAALDPSSAPPPYRNDAGAGARWEAADLDADGVDELLQLLQWKVALRSTSLVVYRVEGARIVHVGSLPLAFDNEGQKGVTASRVVQCGSQHALSDGPDGTRHILVEGTITRAGRKARKTAEAYLHCPQSGSHRYRLARGSLEEVKP